MVAAGAPYLGRQLGDVLREFQAEGLELVYSSAVVTDDLVVTLEPSAVTPRQRLSQILDPLGLSVSAGPGGSLVIVPAAKNPAVLRGRVVAAEGGYRVPLAAVTLTGTSLETRSDRNGLFELSGVPPGGGTLEVRATGFRPASVPWPAVEAGKAAFTLVQLEFESSFVTRVRVIPGQHTVERVEPPAYSLTPADALSAPSTNGDAARVVGFLPGVAAPDNSAGFLIRGGTQRDASVVLDGLELYEPFHLGQFQSPFSLVDSDSAERIDVRAGGFTAELGDRHGGFIEVRTIDPTERGGDLEIGSVNSRFGYRTPLARGSGSLLLSGRTWYPDEVFHSTELGGAEDIETSLQDFYAKASFGVSSRFTWSAHLLFGYDELSFVETGETVNESVFANTRNTNAWVRGLGRWGSNVTSATIVSLGRIDKMRRGVSAPEDDALDLTDVREVSFSGVRHDMTWRNGATRWIKGGIVARRLRATYDYRLGPPGVPEQASLVQIRPDGESVGAYLAYRQAFSPHLAAEFGLRWDRQTYTADNQLSPRFNAAWRPSERTEMRFSIGRFQQSQRIHELSVEDGETTFSRAEVSEQADLSFERRLKAGLLRLDAYYRRLTHLRPRFENLFEAVELFPETAEDRVVVAPDEAELRGLEVFFRSKPENRLTWWTSYTLASAEDRIGGRDVPRSWDQRHAIKFLIGYRTARNWSLSLSGVARSGWPTTPVSGERVPQSDGSLDDVLIVGERNAERLPDYFRFDARMRRRFPARHGHRVWLSFDITNLTNRKNLCCVADFVFAEGPAGAVDVAKRYDSWLGAQPSFSVLWEF